MYSKKNKKTEEIEGNHFKYFRNLLLDFPNGEVWHEDTPDFWIYTSGGILGIEHCLVHRPSNQPVSLQALESQSDEVIAIAQEHAELRGMPKIHATFSFNEFKHLPKKQRIDLARSITQIIYNHISNKDKTPFTVFEIRASDLPEQLSFIHFAIVKNNMRNFWHCARSGWATLKCKKLLQNSIDKKAEKYSDYIKNCRKCWLLMVADINPSSFIHPDQESIDHKYKSPFEKTYFLDCAYGKLYLLKTE